MRNARADSSSGNRPDTRRVMARTQARVSRSLKSTGVRSLTAAERVARTEAERTSYCWAPASASPPPNAAAAANTRLGSRALPIGDPRGHVFRCVGRGDFRRLGIAAVLVLDHAFLEAPLADHDAMRNADQLLVGEQHTRALVAVVEEGLEPRRGELVVELVGRRSHALAAVVTHRDDRDRERRHRA